MVRHPSVLALPAVLVVLVLTAAPVSASGCHQVEEELLAPWPRDAPPGAQRDLLEQAKIVVVIDDPPHEASYWFAADLAYRQCHLGACLGFPDLAVAWYAADDSVLVVEEAGGELDVQGTVPPNAAYGLVFFRTLPYLLSTPVAVPLEVNGSVCA